MDDLHQTSTLEKDVKEGIKMMTTRLPPSRTESAHPHIRIPNSNTLI